MTPQLIYNHSIEDSDIHNLCEDNIPILLRNIMNASM